MENNRSMEHARQGHAAKQEHAARREQAARRAYAALLNLYPREHRAEYGADMLQAFTDQYREAARSGAWSGIPALWLHTLLDLAASALREQASKPHLTAGLLEAPAGKPLPWKGVLLALIPGLIFFVSQIGQLTGKDWFYLMMYRAAYFMIIPVVVVWIWKRKFPIWGLVPLGLLIRTVYRFAYRLQYLAVDMTNPLLAWLVGWYKYFPTRQRVGLIALLLLVICGLLWLVRRREGIGRTARAWLAVYATLTLAKMLASGIDFYTMTRLDHFTGGIFSQPGLGYLIDLAYNDFFLYGVFLITILIGALLARRHGRLAALLPLGYLLPTVIYGRGSNEWPAPGTPDFTFMLWVSATILAYRFLAALAGPLWILRSPSGQMQKRASTFSLAALVVMQAAFNLGVIFNTNWAGNLLVNALMMIAEQLIFGAGLALALALYRERPETAVRLELVPENTPAA